jgi:phospholipase/carboxylesterase
VDGLAAAGVPCLWKITPGTPHSIAPEGLDMGGRFLKDAFAGRYAGWAAPVSRARAPA